MVVTGFYQRGKNGTIKTTGNVRFESTGIKDDYGKVIWRRLRKDGTASNEFAEQFNPNTPWAFGKWFTKIDGGWVLQKYPQLKVETERSKEMDHDAYCRYLSGTYEAI